MTKQQKRILIVLGALTFLAFGLVFFLYLNAGLLGGPDNIIVPTPYKLSAQPTQTPISPPLMTPSPEISSPTPVATQFLEDGIYIVDDSGFYQKIPVVNDDSTLEISSLPVVFSNKPVFAIKGNDYQIDALKLYGYYAGIGVDAELVSLGSGKLGAKIIRVFENSPAEKAGLQPGEIIFEIDGKPFNALDFTFSLSPYRDLVDIFNPSQAITIKVISGTTEKTVTLSRAYRPSGNNFKTKMPITTVAFEPNGDHVLLKVTYPLKPGVYYLAFEQDKTQKWVFVVR